MSCAADDRQALEQPCRVALKLKTLWRDGTTHLIMSSMEFMQGVAALVPRPWMHLNQAGWTR